MVWIRTYKKDYYAVILLLEQNNLKINNNYIVYLYKYIVIAAMPKDSHWRSNQRLILFATDYMSKENCKIKITSKKLLNDTSLLEKLIFEMLL